MASMLRIRHNADRAYRERFVVATPATGSKTFAAGIVDTSPDNYADGMPSVVETCTHRHRSRVAAWACAEELRDKRAEQAADAAEREARVAASEASRAEREGALL